MARLVIVLALVLTGVSLWIAAAPRFGRMFSQSAAQASSPAAAAIAPTEAADLGPVLDFAPFGLAEGTGPVAEPLGEASGLVLLGVTLARSPQDSRAIIAGGDGPTATYGIGEVITPDMVLIGISADHVILSHNGQDQTLSFQPGNPGEAPVPTAFARTMQPPDPPEPPDAAATLGRYRAEIQQDAPGLLARLGLAMTEQGYLVTDAAAPELLQAGLLPDDLIDTVNGMALGNLAIDVALVDEIAATGMASLSVRRGGSTLLMTFPLK